MSTFGKSVSFVVLLACAGCVRNVYRETFIPSASAVSENGGGGQVELRMADPDSFQQLVSDAISEGWIVLGQSGFKGMHNPWSKAIEVAEENGADLIVLCENFAEMGERDAVAVDTVYVHTHEFGNVNIWRRGRVRSRPYSTFSTTAVSQARNIKIPVRFYDQSAVFMRRDTTIGKFGLVLSYKPRTPDVPESAPVEVLVAAVVKNTPAFRQGIVKGQKVVEINGHTIKTYAELAAALGEDEKILSARTVKSDKEVAK